MWETREHESHARCYRLFTLLCACTQLFAIKNLDILRLLPWILDTFSQSRKLEQLHWNLLGLYTEWAYFQLHTCFWLFSRPSHNFVFRNVSVEKVSKRQGKFATYNNYCTLGWVSTFEFHILAKRFICNQFTITSFFELPMFPLTNALLYTGHKQG